MPMMRRCWILSRWKWPRQTPPIPMDFLKVPRPKPGEWSRRGPILRACANRREVIREVRDTVVHELGHHFGLDEDDMPY